MMNVLNRVPKIGIDGGWKPQRRPKQLPDSKAKVKRVLDHPDYRIGGDVEFCDVSFKYVRMLECQNVAKLGPSQFKPFVQTRSLISQLGWRNGERGVTAARLNGAPFAA